MGKRVRPTTRMSKKQQAELLSKVMAPPNAIIAPHAPGIVKVPGRDAFGRKLADYHEMAHIAYGDLASSVRVHLPHNHLVVSVPATRAGTMARAYLPAVMLHSMIEAIICQLYKQIVERQGGTKPTTRQIMDMVSCLERTTKLMVSCWEGEEPQDPARFAQSKSMKGLFQTVVHIENALISSKGQDMGDETLSSVLEKLKTVELNAEVITKQAIEEAYESRDFIGEPPSLKDGEPLIDTTQSFIPDAAQEEGQP